MAPDVEAPTVALSRPGDATDDDVGLEHRRGATEPAELIRRGEPGRAGTDHDRARCCVARGLVAHHSPLPGPRESTAGPRIAPFGSHRCHARPMDSLDFRCPRCGTDTTASFYGPCTRCRDQLRATVRGEAHAIAHEYEPKTNVTPNAVASRDD